ncbi:MAG TPA: response regulator transcription factor [Solirubrobacter sp.]|nr:response regulator transcription factor [Solirubrobacter sp.]
MPGIEGLPSSAGIPPIITTDDAFTPGTGVTVLVVQGLLAGEGGTGHTVGLAAMSGARSAGLPPTITCVCFGNSATLPAWQQVICALMLTSGGNAFPCADAPRSIASPISLWQPPTRVKLFVLDTHTIYRRGLVACLEELDEVELVSDAESVRDAWEHPELFAADIVLVDPSLPGGGDFVGAVRETTGARVIVCSSDDGQRAVRAALQAGAVGYLRKDELTPKSLASAVKAAANGTGVVTPDLLGHLLPRDDAAAPAAVAKLTDREQQVLSLIAAGHPTREVAQELCYSERTVKNVLHDVVTKLNARSRSQAVAFAVREGLI